MTVFFALLGHASVKGARRMLIKLTSNLFLDLVSNESLLSKMKNAKSEIREKFSS